ncbi:MAG: 2-dehydro-3-deoxygalactonokinase [Clostridia bacterium]|nr:2-dehydro-3-deoxygalactonokinase [Clostridia bacterium]
MANYITVDGGTTNTRVSLVCNGQIVSVKKLRIGAGDRDVSALKKAICQAISELLEANGFLEKDIVRILASGMITSEYGLCPLPHITAPAGIRELHDSMYETVMLEISPIPIVFIRGVKIESTDFECADMMRGEETELMGVLEDHGVKTAYVLPGSHSKIIQVDENGKIVDFCILMTGEMIAALSAHTILRDAGQLIGSNVDETYLLQGFEYCQNHGINQALFKVRVLKNLFDADQNQVYSFFMGVVLCSEIREIMKSNVERVVISGQPQLASAMYMILKKYCTKEIVIKDQKAVEQSTAIGAIKIFERLE